MLRASPPKPPDHLPLPENAMPHWWSIMEAREYAAWTRTDLEHAANLARLFFSIQKLNAELESDDEPDIVVGSTGQPVINPKHKLLESMTSRATALSRLLHVHAEATAGESRDDKQRSVKQRNLAKKREELEKGDGLLAPPMH